MAHKEVNWQVARSAALNSVTIKGHVVIYKLRRCSHTETTFTVRGVIYNWAVSVYLTIHYIKPLLNTSFPSKD